MSAASSSKLTAPRATAPASEPEDSDDNASYSSSSEDVTEDEDGTELTPALDAAILRTLGMIKRKEGVYGQERVLEEAIKLAQTQAGRLGSTSAQAAKGKAKDKPFLLSDYHRKALLEAADQPMNEAEDEEDADPRAELTNVQLNAKLRADTLNAFKGLEADADEEDELLVPREKDDEDEAREAEEYRRFLLEMGGGEEEVRRVLGMGDAPVSLIRDASDEDEDEAEGSRPVKREVLSKAERAEMEQKRKERKVKKVKDDEDFLMNYILNRGWIDKSGSHVPTYDEVVADEEVKGEPSRPRRPAGVSDEQPWGVLDEDEFDDKADEFEAQYNFRFEEPGASEIAAHPREISSLVRRGDETRKTKRAARAERKAAERAAQQEETKAKKGKTRREMSKQLKTLREELGDDGLNWDQLEKAMEGDYQEEEWERVVGDMLQKAAEKEDDAKPVWDDDEDYPEEADQGTGRAEASATIEGITADEGGPINMDADFIGFDEPGPSKKARKSKNGKRHRRQDSEEHAGLSVAERAELLKSTMDEYKALDHEDVIGDLPTRFKYTQSAPTNFGLSAAEILLATDAELNSIVSVKHIAPYRTKGLGASGKGINQKVKLLRGQLRKRKWGDRAPHKDSNALEHAPSYGHRGTDVEGSGANTVPVGQRKAAFMTQSAEGKPAKRMGPKQRKKARLEQQARDAALAQGQGAEA